MSTTATTKTTITSSSNDRLPNHHQSSPSFSTEHFVNERYPKTCLEDIPSIMLEYPPPKVGIHSTRSRRSLHFHTQPVTLTEINETEEENKNDNQQDPQPKTEENFQRFEHLALSENIRRSVRKKLPTKNYLERQRLKAMREELSETDGN
jgi:hypothetical protein